MRALLAAAQFQVRGVTRDVSKDTAEELAEKGVEMVAADMNNKDAVAEVVKDAYGVFAVTDFFARVDVELEIQQGKNVVDASKVCVPRECTHKD